MKFFIVNRSKYYRLRYMNITYNYYLQRGQVLLQNRHTYFEVLIFQSKTKKKKLVSNPMFSRNPATFSYVIIMILPKPHIHYSI